MKVYFKTSKLKKLCSQERQMKKAFGRKMCLRLKTRLMELGAVDTLGDISHLPPARCHELKNRNGVFSLNLEYPDRLLLIPADDPVPFKPDGGIDLAQVREVEIIAIEDTHDPKNQRRGKR